MKNHKSSIILIKGINLFFIILSQLLCVKCSNLAIHPNYNDVKSLNKLNCLREEQSYILADRETLLIRGYSTSFTDGYLDGCRTGQYYAGDSLSCYVKQEEHAKVNKDYLIGWQQGNSFCYKHMKNLIKNSGSNDPKIYNSKKAIDSEKQRMWLELKK